MEDKGIEEKPKEEVATPKKKFRWGKIINFVFWIIILLILVKVFQIAMLLKGEGGQCLANPFVYGANNQLRGGGEVACMCNHYTDNKVLPFKFNNSNLEAIPIEQPPFQFNP